MATTKLVTADDLLAMSDDGRLYELIEGVLHEVSPAGFEASEIAVRIGGRLGLFVDERGLGAVSGADGGFFFGRSPDTVRAPDVAFVRANRLPPADERGGFSPVVPDLAVEVVSPSDRQADVDAKIDFYLAHGVPLVWAVYPRHRTVVAHRPGQEPQTFGEGDVLTADDVVPGFRLSVAEIFR